MTLQRGYRNELVPEPLKNTAEGTFLLDMSGQLLGVYMRQRREGEEQKQIISGSNLMFSASNGDVNHRFFSFKSIREQIYNPENYLDMNIQQP